MYKWLPFLLLPLAPFILALAIYIFPVGQALQSDPQERDTRTSTCNLADYTRTRLATRELCGAAPINNSLLVEPNNISCTLTDYYGNSHHRAHCQYSGLLHQLIILYSSTLGLTGGTPVQLQSRHTSESINNNLLNEYLEFTRQYLVYKWIGSCATNSASVAAVSIYKSSVCCLAKGGNLKS